MKEIAGNIWSYWGPKKNNWLGVTINGFVNKNSELVMGAGIALEAKNRFPTLPKILGELFLLNKASKILPPATRPTCVHFLKDFKIFTFPTKVVYWKPSTLDLIEKSTKELKSIIEWGDKHKEFNSGTQFYLVRPGCGNGGLSWLEVRPILVKYFGSDDRVIIVDKDSPEI